MAGKIKAVKTNAMMIFKGRHVPPETTLTVGLDISEIEAQELALAGKEITVVLDPPPSPVAQKLEKPAPAFDARAKKEKAGK